jgi:hypothetical protein
MQEKGALYGAAYLCLQLFKCYLRHTLTWFHSMFHRVFVQKQNERQVHEQYVT